MYYKLLNGDIVIDILNKATYVRYLPKAQKWIQSGSGVAHGIMGSDQNTIYLLEERNCAYETNLPHVRVVEIEDEELYSKIAALETTLTEQNALLQQILAKL